MIFEVIEMHKKTQKNNEQGSKSRWKKCSYWFIYQINSQSYGH